MANDDFKRLRAKWIESINELLGTSARKTFAHDYGIKLSSLEKWLAPNGSGIPDPTGDPANRIHDALNASTEVRKVLEAAWKLRPKVTGEPEPGFDFEGEWLQEIDASPVYWGGREWLRDRGRLLQPTRDLVTVATSRGGALSGAIIRIDPIDDAPRAWEFEGSIYHDAGWSLTLRFTETSGPFSRGHITLTPAGPTPALLYGLYTSRHYIFEAEPAADRLADINGV